MPEQSPISTDVVRHVAALARLEISDDEVAHFTEQLGAVLRHASDVEALDIGDVPPTTHALPLKNVLRKDEFAACLDRDVALSQAPAHEAGQFKVPRILGDEQ